MGLCDAAAQRVTAEVADVGSMTEAAKNGLAQRAWTLALALGRAGWRCRHRGRPGWTAPPRSSRARRAARRWFRSASRVVTRQDVPLYLRGLGTVQAFNSVLVRARVDGTLMQVPGHRGPGGQAGRPARRHRSAPVSGRARRGDGEEEPGRGRPRQCQARPGALHLARAEELRLAPAGRHAAGAGQSHDRRDRRRRCGDRDGAAQPELLLSSPSPIQGRVGLRQVDPGNLVHAADADRRSSRSPRSIRSRCCSRCRRTACRRISVAMAAGQAAGDRLRGDDKTELDQGTLLTADNAIDTTHRHDQAEGDLPEPAQHAVARPVRQRAPAARHRAERC